MSGTNNTNTNIVFGNKCVFKRPNARAFCFQHVTRDKNDFGMNIDVAPNPNNRPNWSEKLTIQLSIDEICELVAFLLRRLDSVNFSYHGSHKNMSVLMQRRVTDKGEEVSVAMLNAGKQAGYVYLKQGEAFTLYKLCNELLSKHYRQSERDLIFSIRTFFG